MDVRRLEDNKFGIYLTEEDFQERGLDHLRLDNGDIENLKSHIDPILQDAADLLGFDLHSGLKLILEVIMGNAGVTIIATVVSSDSTFSPLSPFGLDLFNQYNKPKDKNSSFNGGVSKETSKETLTYVYSDFEYLVQLAPRLHSLNIPGGKVYHYKGQYYLHLILPASFNTSTRNKVLGVLQEYGDRSEVTLPILQEYGKTIFSDLGVKHIMAHFH